MIPTFTRRQMLRTIGGGFGALGLAGVLAAGGPAAPPTRWRRSRPTSRPRAKRVIFLFMNGGPSHVDTFDPKPALAKHNGETPPEAARQAGARPAAC